MSVLLKQALEYTAAGFRVFPAEPQGKKPLLTGSWKNAATSNEEQIREWWTAYPDANIAIACGHMTKGNKFITVVDMDDKPDRGVNGFRELFEWQKEHGALPETLTAKSGSGGLHYYFFSDVSYKNGANILGADTGVDVRSENGYIIAPPSVHKCGRHYEWTEGFNVSLIADGGKILDKLLVERETRGIFPALPKRVKQFQTSGGVTDRIITKLGLDFGEGNRNDSIHRLVSSLQARGYADSEIYSICGCVNRERCTPPLPEKEVESSVGSALKSIAKGKDCTKDSKAEKPPRLDRIYFAQYVEEMREPRMSLRFNDITHKIEIRGCENENPEQLHDLLPAILFDELCEYYSGVTIGLVENNIKMYASLHHYNPILDAISAVKWDGTDRLEEIYALFGIEIDDWLSRVVIRKWCMQCWCRLYNNIETPFSLDIILVFQGRQGIGKTRFFEHIALGFFGNGVSLDPRDKDSIMYATSKWITELGEIGSIMRKDVDSIKAFTTRDVDEYRAPYGRSFCSYPRRTSFVGTVNDEEYLVDQTGNRRFATAPIAPNISLDYETQIRPFDAVQLWAQIARIVEIEMANGETLGGCFRLNHEELKAMEARNAGFKKPLRGEQEIRDVLASYQPQNGWQCREEWQTASEFKSTNSELHNIDAACIGKILTRLGVEKQIDSKRRVTLYRLPRRVQNG